MAMRRGDLNVEPVEGDVELIRILLGHLERCCAIRMELARRFAPEAALCATPCTCILTSARPAPTHRRKQRHKARRPVRAIRSAAAPTSSVGKRPP